MTEREKIQSVLLTSLEEAGKTLKEGLCEKKVITEKGEFNLVTEFDRRAEETIVRNILRAFPDHAILTEESPAQGNSPFRWIIDPLDGTTNFAHSFPVACVSIGLQKENQMIFGGIYDPFREELFYAEKGRGATLNGQPIVVSQNPTLRHSLLATGFPYDRRQSPDDYLAVFKSFMLQCQGIRRMGAAAIDLAYVACGRFDGFWELKLHIWDIAAAILILEEAGGKLSDFQGKPLNLSREVTPVIPQTIATNGFVHEEMIRTLKPFVSMGK